MRIKMGCVATSVSCPWGIGDVRFRAVRLAELANVRFLRGLERGKSTLSGPFAPP